MKLDDVLQDLDVRSGPVPAGVTVRSVVCDSRQVAPGDVFVAIPGHVRDGRLFVREACTRGAVAIVSEAPLSDVVPLWIQVPDARQALSCMADRVFGQPSRRMECTAVTGTNGKTTTCALLAEIFRCHGDAVGLMTTVQVEIADRVIPTERTTPDASRLHATLADMVRHECQRAVIEVSSHAIDQRRVEAVRWASAVFTNLTRDHLDYHGTMDDYFAVKLRLFEALAAIPGAPAIVNADDPWGQRLAQTLTERKVPVLTYGLESGDVRAAQPRLTAGGASFELQSPWGNHAVKTALMGRYNIANVLAAVTAACAHGVPAPTALAAVRAFTPRWGRLEPVSTGRDFSVFVDYAHTDDALENVLRTLREITSGRIIVVFGCGGDRDPGKRPLMGAAAARGADILVVTSDNPRSENPRLILAQTLEGVPPATVHTVEVDRRKAIFRALDLARPGDTVLVAGKGHEAYQEMANTVTPFDDREVCREWVRDAGN